MKEMTLHDMIEVESLRVGMFVHLEGGWMSHPFPLSSFRIASPEQIATIRSLGLQRVRWSPQQSDPKLRICGGSDWSGLDDRRGRRVDAGPVTTTQAGVFATTSQPTTPSQAAALAESETARREHRQKLNLQRAALKLCERQFAEAAVDCRQISDLVLQRPQEAREQAEMLTGALAGKMLGEQELCIRLLSDVTGDKASLHALNVTLISMLMGKSFGLAEAEMRDLGLGALLHDMGKLDLPDRLRHRDDDFTSAEWRFYEEHVARGIALARKMGLSPGAALVIAQHHEHADGTGFPLRLNSDRMTVGARIVALVNRYDNLCNPHQPGKALTPHEALSLLFAQGKSKFDTAILGAFIRMMGVYPAGSTVQLTDDRFAMVVGVNSSRPLKPRVLVHDAGVPRDDALILDLERSAGLGIRRSVKPQQLPAPVIDYLAPRPRVAYYFEPVGEVPLAA